jgi:hypothetical protein
MLAISHPSRAYRACGLVGLAVAATLALALASTAGLSLWTESALIASAVLTFFVVALATKAVSGRENLIYYHHEIAVLTVVGTACAVAGAPVAGHLDVTALGLGAFLACGRLGCLHAGCCHGRPARRGVRYGSVHVREGFPAALAGVPLVPLQAIEAAAVTAIVAGGCLIVLAGAPAGAAALWYVSAYAVLRFALEERRGDGARRYWWRFSEAQWTSLTLLGAGALAGLVGLVPSGTLHLAVLGAAAAVVLSSLRRPAPPAADEIATALAASHGRVVETASGVRCSTGAGHYTFSGTADAAGLAELVERLQHPGARIEVARGAHGTLHLVVDP